MASTIYESAAAGGRNRSFIGQIGNYFCHLAEAHPRMKKLRAYSAMSDQELAARGLTRDKIVEHVFGVYYYI